MKKKITAGKILLIVLCALAVCALLYAVGALYPDGRGSAGEASLRSWMGGIDDARKLSEISIPGTHDSATQYIFPDYFLQDQDTTIARQLENGYRYLDIRVALGADGELVMIHNFGKCRTGAAVFAPQMGYLDVVAAARAFLAENPTETVMFCVKPEKSSDDPAAVRAVIERIVAEEPELWYTENEIPTLGEVRGKIVLCRRYDGALGLDFNWDDQGDPTVLDDPTETHRINDAQSLVVQDRYHYAVEDKWNAVRYTLENCPAGEDCFCLNFLSTAQGKLPHPRSFARQMNALFAQYAPAGGCCGVVLFDFADAALARQVIERNN